MGVILAQRLLRVLLMAVPFVVLLVVPVRMTVVLLVVTAVLSG
jgi:hypothetical protein